VPGEVDHPTRYSSVIAHAQLARLASTIYHEFLSAKTAKSEIEYQVADGMDQRIADWKRSLPNYFTAVDAPHWFLGPRAILEWRAENLRIMLWRGSKRRHRFLSGKADARQRGLNAAMQTIHDIASFCNEHSDILSVGTHNWYATYFVFQAALTLHVSNLSGEARLTLRNKNEGEESDWFASLAQSRAVLEVLGKTHNAANRCIDVLDRIHSLLAGSARSQEGEASIVSCSSHEVVQVPVDDHAADDTLDPWTTEGTVGDLAWASAVDPALHTFLDHMPDLHLDNFFVGVEGFPATLEPDTFDYVLGSRFVS
jgi:transcriptional regulatory protein GAL4